MRAAQWGLTIALGLAASAAAPEAASAEPLDAGPVAAGQIGARIWLDGEPSYFRRGDRLNVRFSVPYDSYVAVVHIDTDGSLDFLYPLSPWDNQFLRGGRIHSLPVRGSFASTTIRSRPGIGYIYLIASPTPLDFRYFQGGIGTPWGWDYAGRNVYGDPFLAFEQITRLLLPRWPYAQYIYDYHSYYVEGLHRYPTFACSDRYYSRGWGWSPAFGSCGRIDIFLRQYPDYYDTRRYAGDRRIYLRQFERLDPLHGFKENPDPGPGFGTRFAVPRESRGSSSADELPSRNAIPAQLAPSGGESREAVPQRAPATPERDAEPASRAPVGRSAPELQPRTPADRPPPAAAPSGERTRPVPATEGRSGGEASPTSANPPATRGGRP